MPRFVVLQHDFPDLHWDFMLECGEVLKTWKLAAAPTCGTIMTAENTADHRPFYLDYEGPVSRNRGTVSRWGSGSFDWLPSDENHRLVHFASGDLLGEARLSQIDAGLWSLDLSKVRRPD